MAKDSNDLGYEVKFSPEQSEWPQTCIADDQNSGRKKRQIILDGIIPKQYSYINVIIDVQFNNETVTYDDVR